MKKILVLILFLQMVQWSAFSDTSSDDSVIRLKESAYPVYLDIRFPWGYKLFYKESTESVTAKTKAYFGSFRIQPV